MATNATSAPDVSAALIEAIRTMPTKRVLNHCGMEFSVSPFDIYASCPHCGKRIKLRGYSAQPEVVDVFDAVFEWLRQPEADAAFRQRLAQLQADDED